MTKQIQQPKQSALDIAKQEVARLQYGDDYSKEAVGKAVESAVKALRSGRQSVQKAAVLILLRAYKHGDYSAATQLVEQLGNGINGKALVEWFREFGGLRTKDGEQGFIGWRGAEYIEQRFEQAKAMPWWTMQQQNPWDGFDLNKQLARVLKQHSNAQKKVESGQGEQSQIDLQVDADVKAQLLALLQAL